jgi:hypothetical protein
MDFKDLVRLSRMRGYTVSEKNQRVRFVHPDPTKPVVVSSGDRSGDKRGLQNTISDLRRIHGEDFNAPVKPKDGKPKEKEKPLPPPETTRRQAPVKKDRDGLQILNAEYGGKYPHIHLKDPKNPLHLVTGLRDGRTHVYVGGNTPGKCPLHVTLDLEGIHVGRAERFTRYHYDLLMTALTSLGTIPAEREEALGWMMQLTRETSPLDGFWHGRKAPPAPEMHMWPSTLDDEDLIEALHERIAMSKVRFEAIVSEVQRRGLDSSRKGKAAE